VVFSLPVGREALSTGFLFAFALGVSAGLPSALVAARVRPADVLR
jgi:ABC-type antimicrobial peptide transport system permease subunit